ncbi:MAG: hypothetical protein JWR68_158 [Polaromonas sp.]|nr:hypothetical protein [Polaromonas sp.]
MRGHGKHLRVSTCCLQRIQIEPHEALATEVDIVATVLPGVGAKGDRQPEQRARYPELVALEVHLPVVLDDSHRVCSGVVDGGQRWPIADGAGTVTAGRRAQAQRIVRALVVVHAAPARKGALRLGQAGKAAPGQHLGFQRAMKPLDLAVGLRVVRRAVADPDAQADQPDTELAQAMAGQARAAPGRAIVRIDAHRQPIALEHLRQVRLHAGRGHAGAGLQRQIEARVVVQQRQGVAAPLAGRKVALEVDLPQRVGRFVLEALPGLGRFAGLGRDQAVAVQDCRDGARPGHIGQAQFAQTPGDLAPAPTGVLPAQSCDGLLHLGRRARRAGVGLSRARYESRIAFERMARQQGVSRLGVDAKAPAQLAPVGPLLQG